MLVLSRNVGQSICINGHEITVTVSRVSGNKVWLAIDAPPSVSVHRAEVQDRIDEDDLNDD